MNATTTRDRIRQMEYRRDALLESAAVQERGAEDRLAHLEKLRAAMGPRDLEGAKPPEEDFRYLGLLRSADEMREEAGQLQAQIDVAKSASIAPTRRTPTRKPVPGKAK